MTALKTRPVSNVRAHFIEAQVLLKTNVWVHIEEVQAKDDDDLEFDDELLDLDSLDVLESKIAF